MIIIFLYFSCKLCSIQGLRFPRDHTQWIENWYATLQPIDASSPGPANRMLTRKNVCLSVKNGGDYPFAWEEPRALQKVWRMQEIPSNYSGRIEKGAVLLATVHHFNNYIWGNIGHWSSSAYAIFDALDTLKDHHHGRLPVNVTAVLMQQANNLLQGAWHRQIAQLIGNSNGLETKFIQGTDLDHGVLCAEQIILYDRPDKKERHYFSTPHHAQQFQEQAIKALHLPNELRSSVRKPGRVLNMVLRTDEQGYKNWQEINEKTRKYLATRCWEMVEYRQKKEILRNQAEAWAKGDLSVSVHGAHFSNLVFQGQKTGIIIVEKPGVEDFDNCQLGQEMGLLTYKVGPKNTPKICMQDLLRLTSHRKGNFNFARSDMGLWAEQRLEQLYSQGMESTPQENAPFSLSWEKHLKPVLEKAIDDLEAIAVRGPPCRTG